MGFSIIGSNQILISHSSKDDNVISAVDQAFDGLGKKAYFVEREITGTPPAKKIDEVINESDGIFAFLTPNSTVGDTRDWIVFEMGIAFARGKKVYAWKERSSSTVDVPRFLEQITTYRDFEPTVQGMFKLTNELKKTAKKFYSLL